MNHLLYRGILLAQGSRLDSMSSRFRRGGGTRIDFGDVLIGVLVLGVLIAVVWAISYVVKLQEKGRGFSSSLGLFLVLCKAHQLRWPERWLLWRLARSQRLRDPTRLFLEPERFEPAYIGPALQARAAELKQLGDRLFVRPEAKKDDSEGGCNGAAKTEPAKTGSAKTPATPAAPVPTLDIPPWPPTSATPTSTADSGQDSR